MFLQPGACQYVLAKSRSSSRFTVTLQYTTCAEVESTITWIQLHRHYIDVTCPCVCSVCLQQQVCIQSVTVVLDEDVNRQITLTREGEVIIGVNPAPILPYVDGRIHKSSLIHKGFIFWIKCRQINLEKIKSCLYCNINFLSGYVDAVEVRKLTSVFTMLRAGFGLRLHYDGRGGRVYLQLDSQWRGQTLGLCGTFNGNLRDDFLWGITSY